MTSTARNTNMNLGSIAGTGFMRSGDENHADRVLREMRELGASPYSMNRFESRYLPRIVHPDEHIKGVVYGRSKDGSVMLIATDRRTIYLDKKPFFVSEDEITYDIVSGISYGRSLFSVGIKLHTRIGDYEVRTFNKKCAEGFVEFIESRCLENHGGTRRISPVASIR